MKIQIKITLLFTLLAVAIILLLSGAVYYFANRYSFRDFYKRLEIRAIIAAKANLDSDVNNVSLYNEIRKEHLERLPAEQEYIVALDSLTKHSLQFPQQLYKQTLAEEKAFYRKGDLFYASLLYPEKNPTHMVVIAAKNEYSSQQLSNLRNILLTGLGVAIIAAASVGWLFSNEVLKPIRNISRQVNDINTHNLHLRLETDNRNRDEICALAETFNDMLNRLETSFDTQRNFVSNASHELRTPLTAIIGETELALAKSRDEAQYRAALGIILKEAERLNHITTSLLSLAQTGFNGQKLQLEPVRVDELLLSVQEAVHKIYPNRLHIDYSLMPEDDTKLTTVGNHQLLNLAISNIVLNGCKYSGSGKPVMLALTATRENILIIVKDQGIGIPEKELRFIFDPFFRASNSLSFKGYGIGLPLTRNILRMHHGDIAVSSVENQGTIVQVTLPIA
ncbi:sensor histidine kinase [Deminuibacter soli]|uniref:histidine kinase n=1 Tax=Deminuibacter soli TaxID=2291815 RepID=A0A3E1NDS3_9BACT|nr:HAMP domain-containing sensor histidine kinase [Deminuibacter soli]RFM26119.1 sensor histidine kinase [Deminuibacter soli]